MLSTMNLSSMLSIFEEEQQLGTKGFTEELAFVDRADGYGLEGAIIRPTNGETKPVAIIWIHGNTSRFYDMPYIQIGREMAALGYTFITSNTHGHDIASIIWGPNGEAQPGGACWERFDEVPLDLSAWIDMAIEEGSEGVVLVGHSFGANKVIYYQAQKQDERVLGVVSASGDVKWKATPDRVALAEQMEADGRDDEVLPQLEMPWYRMSAKTYLGRARIAQHVFDADTETPHIAKVQCPILAFYGTEEEWCGSASDLDMIRRNAVSSTRVETHLVDGADHVFWDKANVAARLIGDWVDGLRAA
ncbi:MAG: alpha/beta fold hydrolase [Chloroflexota bacterium]